MSWLSDHTTNATLPLKFGENVPYWFVERSGEVGYSEVPCGPVRYFRHTFTNFYQEGPFNQNRADMSTVKIPAAENSDEKFNFKRPIYKILMQLKHILNVYLTNNTNG